MNEPRTSEPLVAALETLSRNDDRAALAALRASLSEDAVAKAYPYVIPFLPQGSPLPLVRSYLLVAGLFALHPACGSLSLGAALRRVRDGTGSSSIEQRFVALLDAHPDDLGTHLRHAVSLARSAEVAIDWNNLLRTVRGWGSESTRRRWALDFWAPTSPKEGASER